MMMMTCSGVEEKKVVGGGNTMLIGKRCDVGRHDDEVLVPSNHQIVHNQVEKIKQESQNDDVEYWSPRRHQQQKRRSVVAPAEAPPISTRQQHYSRSRLGSSHYAINKIRE
ncbi:OLC1v1014371C1 [Oldenlandia corymbosa var. corymbosa]|uniref:OLC1v1014371C1 n=2 Tax=Oldenlandia corymbosa var. corymbosa TaxID=529605 RepID=A0AAV1E460_OLDCO|nr:OLC1v1014371C1 [Oldenlandia corymbosa var. corymbosa]